jgi:hypothetical protein
MKTIDRRIRKLEDRFGLAAGKPPLLIVVTLAAKKLALDQDRCVQILGECGFLPKGPVGVVHLGKIPNGLDAKETERFLRANGAEICGLRPRTDDGPADV